MAVRSPGGEFCARSDELPWVPNLSKGGSNADLDDCAQPCATVAGNQYSGDPLHLTKEISTAFTATRSETSIPASSRATISAMPGLQLSGVWRLHGSERRDNFPGSGRSQEARCRRKGSALIKRSTRLQPQCRTIRAKGRGSNQPVRMRRSPAGGRSRALACCRLVDTVLS